jgi:hypothetical protein
LAGNSSVIFGGKFDGHFYLEISRNFWREIGNFCREIKVSFLAGNSIVIFSGKSVKKFGGKSEIFGAKLKCYFWREIRLSFLAGNRKFLAEIDEY